MTKDKTTKAKATKPRNKKAVEQFVEAIVYPIVTKGSHLTVTQYEDGTTELVWDDEALLRDVREAIASVSK